MSKETKAMLKSWFNVFIAALLSALIVVFGDGQITVEDLWYVLSAGIIAVLPVIKNYFDKNDPRYGRTNEGSVSDTE